MINAMMKEIAKIGMVKVRKRGEDGLLVIQLRFAAKPRFGFLSRPNGIKVMVGSVPIVLEVSSAHRIAPP